MALPYTIVPQPDRATVRRIPLAPYRMDDSGRMVSTFVTFDRAIHRPAPILPDNYPITLFFISASGAQVNWFTCGLYACRGNYYVAIF